MTKPNKTELAESCAPYLIRTMAEQESISFREVKVVFEGAFKLDGLRGVVQNAEDLATDTRKVAPDLPGSGYNDEYRNAMACYVEQLFVELKVEHFAKVEKSGGVEAFLSAKLGGTVKKNEIQPEELVPAYVKALDMLAFDNVKALLEYAFKVDGLRGVIQMSEDLGADARAFANSLPDKTAAEYHTAIAAYVLTSFVPAKNELIAANAAKK